MKNQDNIWEEKVNQLDVFIFLDTNTTRLKAIWIGGHVYMMMLLTLPQGLEST